MCDRIHINRIFDLKGSRYNRENINNRNRNNLSNITLLDIDFLNTEKLINIDNIGSRNVKRFLSEDIGFLKKMGVMDYSLLVMKVNWEEIAFFKNKKLEDVLPKGSNAFEILPCETEIGIFYHFAIIDYLQTYTALKNAENFLKKVIVR